MNSEAMVQGFGALNCHRWRAVRRLPDYRARRAATRCGIATSLIWAGRPFPDTSNEGLSARAGFRTVLPPDPPQSYGLQGAWRSGASLDLDPAWIAGMEMYNKAIQP